MQNLDVLIIGGGIIGFAVARAIRLRRADLRIVLVENSPEMPNMPLGGIAAYCSLVFTIQRIL
jgi:2-polyprenyl-6-methoxyphenol hydroxylase-like FAD-dependent oxidoreductase